MPPVSGKDRACHTAEVVRTMHGFCSVLLITDATNTSHELFLCRNPMMATFRRLWPFSPAMAALLWSAWAEGEPMTHDTLTSDLSMTRP